MSTHTSTERYELMVIVTPDIGEAAIAKRLEAIKKTIADFGGDVFFEDIWGLRNLAYEIKKQSQGYYAVLDVNLETQHIKDFDRILRLEVEVLRHLITKLPANYKPKSIVEMETEIAALMPEEKKEVKRDSRPRFERAPQVVPVVAKEKKVEVAEESPKKTPAKKSESKQSVQDIDAKLDSILSNPDINF